MGADIIIITKTTDSTVYISLGKRYQRCTQGTIEPVGVHMEAWFDLIGEAVCEVYCYVDFTASAVSSTCARSVQGTKDHGYSTLTQGRTDVDIQRASKS